MTDAVNGKEILSRASAATTERTKIRLNEIKFDMERYCHRDSSALLPENLTSLLESLILEGLQVPIEFYREPNGNIVLVKGHRRVTACRLAAGKNEPGFTADMEIDAIEVRNASPVDLLVRSICDNEVRLNLDRIGRIRVAKKMHDAGVSTDRAARAMGVSVKTFDRDVLIARFPWMFQHVIDGSVAPTHAVALLEEAEKAGRTAVMREDLDSWIASKKQKIRENEKLRKARDNKELSPADKQVKKYLPNHLVTHWVELLREEKRFDEDAKWNFAAGIEKETEQLRISSVSLDLSKAPLDRLAKVVGKLSLLTKQMVPYIKKAQEKAQGIDRPDAVESAYDLEFLRDLGLEDVVSELDAETRLAKFPDGEESPQDQPPERQEQDLTQEVELPPMTSTPTPESALEPTSELEAATEPESTPVTVSPPTAKTTPAPATPSASPAKNAPTGKKGVK